MANLPATVIATASMAYAENAAAVAVSPSLSIFDDNANLFGAKVTISGGFQAGQDVLSFTSQFGITGSFNAGTGVLTLSGTATLAQYQTVLRSVKYLNSSDAPVTGNRTVRFEVNDGAPPNPLNILTSTANVNVIASNDRPIIAGLDTMLYTGSAQSLKQVIDADLTVTDPDSSTLNGATVRITGHYVQGQDVLGFVAQNGIVGSFNAATGTLSLFGHASVAAYQAAFRSITYQNTQPTGTDVADRTVSFQVKDNLGATSFAATATIMFAVAPLITTSPGTAAYIEGGATALVDGALTVTDLDTPTLAGATISISVGFQVGDLLAFVDTANITGSYNPATG
ncbi:hypothetical protein EEB15_08095, partial [Ramlibacter sp. WS9]